MSKTYTVKQVAEILGYSTNSIYTFLQEGRIKGIRVGKGRFRIPEEEIQRILQLSKKESSSELAEYGTLNNEITVKKVEGAPEGKIFDLRLDIINLFDWFFGVGSVLLGFSMSLYNRFNLLTQSVNLSIWINTLQISLIAGGLGFLLTDIFDKNINPNWRKFFQAILIILFTSITAFNYYLADGGGVILFGIFVFVVVLKSIFGLAWIESFLILVLLHSVAVPLTLNINPSLIDLPDNINSILKFSTYSLGIWTLLSLFLGLLLWLSHKKNWKLFWPLMILYGSVYIYFSLELVGQLAWTKVFFLLLLGLTCVTFPIWEAAYYFRHQGKNLVTTFFSLLLFIFVVIISVIWVMEQNIKEYAVKELNNKAVIGKILLETFFSNVEGTLVEASLNPLVIEAVKEGDEVKATEIMKLIFNTDNHIRRLILLKSNGDKISFYPYIKTTTDNFAFRDYFSEAKRTKKIYYSDTFESQTEPKLIVSTISIPIFDEGEMIGVFAAGLDLPSIGNRLQKIANPENQEYFVVMDKLGNRVLHPDASLVGTRADPSNIIYKLPGENEGLGEGYNHREIRTFQAFQTIKQNGWIIQIHSPVLQVLKPTSAVSKMLFYSIVFIIALIGIFIFLVRKTVKN